MPLDFDQLSPEELLAAESAVLTMRSLMDAACSAPHGHGMERVESALHERGFEHLRDMLQAAMVPARRERGAKKGACSLPCPCGKQASFKWCKQKTVLSSVGHIAVSRRYYACRHCKAKPTPWEQWAGVDGPHRITPHARRMVVLAGSGCSFDEASRNLKELSHLPVSNDVIRRVCDEEGVAVRQWMSDSPEPRKAFDTAEGVVEFYTDGLKINTIEGWREIRQSVIGKREPALPAQPPHGSSGYWSRRRCAWRSAPSPTAS